MAKYTPTPDTDYIKYTSRIWCDAADGIAIEAGQVYDRDQSKFQHTINAEVKQALAGINGQIGTALTGVYKYKGSKTDLAEVQALTNVKIGDVWNVVNEFTLGGKKYPAGTNVAALADKAEADANNWDALGGTVDLKPLKDKLTELEQKDTAIDAYTINKKAIKTNPVLSADDIAVNGFALSDKVNDQLMPAEGDTTKVVFGKVYKAIQDNEAVTATAFNKIKTVLGVADTNFAMPDMSGTNYLKTATVFLDALKSLDTTLKKANDKIAELETKLATANSKISAIETSLTNEVTAADIDTAMGA